MMRRTLRFLFAILAVCVLVFVVAPRPVARDKPVPEPVDPGSAAGKLVVDLVDGASAADLARVSTEAGGELAFVSDQGDAIALGDVPDLDAALDALRADPSVEVAEPDVMIALEPQDATEVASSGSAGGFPNDPMYDKQWNLRAMGAPVAWSATPQGKGVVVAVIDTGVTKVEDLENTTILTGASFVPGAKTSADDNGHGTHVAGTIAESTNNGKGVAGVAPGATILPVKVLSGGGFGSSGWIASGIDYAVAQGADVINLSLGGGYSAVIHNAIKRATKKGVVVVAAVGNSGREGASYPGGLPETIGVSAVGPSGNLAFYSSWGKGTDIAAPGGDKRTAGGGILQDTVDGKGGHAYLEYQGTSMATPHVAGAAAVLLSTGMEPQQVEDALLNSATGTSGKWDPKLGYGRLDLGAALGNVIDKTAAYRFFLAAVIALLVMQTGGLRSGFRAMSAGIAALTAGGVFFLPWLPMVPDNVVVHVLSRGVLLWPAALSASTWVNFPLWLSCGLPMLAAFTLGASRATRPLALGFAVGVGAHLIHGAATGTLNPWWMPAGLDVVWLAANGVVCLLLGLALAGTEKLDAERN